MYYLLLILAIGDSESEKRFPAVEDTVQAVLVSDQTPLTIFVWS